MHRKFAVTLGVFCTMLSSVGHAACRLPDDKSPAAAARMVLAESEIVGLFIVSKSATSSSPEEFEQLHLFKGRAPPTLRLGSISDAEGNLTFDAGSPAVRYHAGEIALLTLKHTGNAFVNSECSQAALIGAGRVTTVRELFKVGY